MGRKGSPRHRKRLSAPTTYSIKRKHGTFTIRPYPTRSKMELSIPLGLIMREMLGYAKTLSEVKRILVKKIVKVDGKIRTSYKFGVGPMDIVEISQTDEFFRLTPYRGKRRLKLHPIAKEEAHLKMLRIQGKRTTKRGLIQLTFHDGRNHLINQEEEQEIPIDQLSIKDSVLFNLEEKIIEKHYPFAEENTALIMGGHNVGIVGKIQQIEPETQTVTLKTDEREIKTKDEHIFMIGQEKPAIEIPEEIGDESDEL